MTQEAMRLDGPWKCGDEFLPYHPSASHIAPEYRDGWNACYAASRAQGAAPTGASDEEIISLARIASTENHYSGGRCVRMDFTPNAILAFAAGLRASNAEGPKPDGWRTIESAPKDGSEVWAFNGEQARMRWIEGDGYALWIWADELLSDVDPDCKQPTHWQSLPAPPSSSQEGV